MPELEIEGRSFSVDNRGFLRQPELWDEEVALLFAREQGLESLSGTHWRIIRYIRACFLESGKAPLIRAICNECRVTLRQIYELFPKGPIHGASKIAGLPKPDGCV